MGGKCYFFPRVKQNFDGRIFEDNYQVATGVSLQIIAKNSDINNGKLKARLSFFQRHAPHV
jgi:hypothetical protein